MFELWNELCAVLAALAPIITLVVLGVRRTVPRKVLTEGDRESPALQGVRVWLEIFALAAGPYCLSALLMVSLSEPAPEPWWLAHLLWGLFLSLGALLAFARWPRLLAPQVRWSLIGLLVLWVAWRRGLPATLLGRGVFFTAGATVACLIAWRVKRLCAFDA